MAEFTLSDLAGIVSARAAAAPEESYTASLVAKGPAYCARKFGEEAIEAVVAAAEGDGAGLTAEAADVLYHLLVMLEARKVPLADVMAVLAARTRQGGHAEKAARQGQS
jgi:phosphoribosyl-ATP pyrophosphohydrolase